jgi:hypothetical protein
MQQLISAAIRGEATSAPCAVLHAAAHASVVYLLLCRLAPQMHCKLGGQTVLKVCLARQQQQLQLCECVSPPLMCGGAR